MDNTIRCFIHGTRQTRQHLRHEVLPASESPQNAERCCVAVNTCSSIVAGGRSNSPCEHIAGFCHCETVIAGCNDSGAPVMRARNGRGLADIHPRVCRIQVHIVQFMPPSRGSVREFRGGTRAAITELAKLIITTRHYSAAAGHDNRMLRTTSHLQHLFTHEHVS